MKRLNLLLVVMVLLAGLSPRTLWGETALEGERVLTPNEERHIQKANEELPKDMRSHDGDSKPVADLRAELREAVNAYKKTVSQFGHGKPETKQACRHVVDVQKSLHQQFVKEEAIPAISQLPN